jgi:hypothetical protein
LPAEPSLSPDNLHIVTADFCAKDCSNEVSLWQVSRDGVVKVASWKPSPTWSDAAITWKDNDTLAIDYTAMGEATGKSQERKLDDRLWQRVAAH